MHNRKLLIMIVLLSFTMSFFACSQNNERSETALEETIIYEDISFVQSKFPKIRGIEGVKYIYVNLGDSGIGLQPKKFRGVIQIDDNYTKEIYQEYEWEEQEIELLPFKGAGKYTVLYSNDFDEHIHTSSFVGDFYFDETNNYLYFFGGY